MTGEHLGICEVAVIPRHGMYQNHTTYYLLKYKAPQFIKEFIIEGEISMAHIII